MRSCFFFKRALNVIVPPELEGVSQKRAELRTCYWLDVVLPGDRLLQKEVGGGPKDGGSESPEPARLPGKLLGTFQLAVKSV